jgi:hypothetical protein
VLSGFGAQFKVEYAFFEGFKIDFNREREIVAIGVQLLLSFCEIKNLFELK